MFTFRSAKLAYVVLAILIVALIALPTITIAAAPQGFTPTPTEPPPTDTPPTTDTPPPPTDMPPPTDTPPVTDTPPPTPTATDGTIVPPPPTSPTPTPTTAVTTPAPTNPPPRSPRATATEQIPLLPVTGQLPPDSGGPDSGNSSQMFLVLLAFLTALVIGFTSGKRVREWLSSIGILGTILILLSLSFGLAFWSSSPSYAAVESSAIEDANQALSAAQAPADLRESLTSHGGSLDHKMRKNMGTSQRILSSASSTRSNDPLPLAAGLDLPSFRDLDATAVHRITIPALKVDTAVIPVPFDGATWDVSGIGGEVAWLERTSQPGLGGNTVLAGHITARDIGNGPFRYLNGLAAGESVFLFTENNLYKYSVREFRIVAARDGSVTKPTDNPQLTLVTCSTWDELASQYSKRRVVFADLVEVKALHDYWPTYQAQ